MGVAVLLTAVRAKMIAAGRNFIVVITLMWLLLLCRNEKFVFYESLHKEVVLSSCVGADWMHE